MTSLAFILGVVPLVVSFGAGAEMRQSLGTAVFFGMLGVTLLRPGLHAGLLRRQHRALRAALPVAQAGGPAGVQAGVDLIRLEMRHASLTHPSRARPGSRSGGRHRRPPDRAIVRRKRPRGRAAGGRRTGGTGAHAKWPSLAGGCFWGVQGVFQHVDGVTSAVSGYAGGAKETAEYEKVGSGRTGHAEFGAHHLRSAQGELRPPAADLFLGRPRSDRIRIARARTSARSIARRSSRPATSRPRWPRPISTSSTRPDAFGAKIVTTIEPGRTFYPAEGYHQDYLTLHPNQPYIAINDLPKVANLKRLFAQLLSRRAGAGQQDRHVAGQRQPPPSRISPPDVHAATREI